MFRKLIAWFLENYNKIYGVNPFKEFTYLTPLIDYVKSKKAIVKPKTSSKKAINSFSLVGDVWEVTFHNSTTILKDAKGLHDVQKLLKEPSIDFHCLDLMESVLQENEDHSSIDKKAKTAYHSRIKELQEDIDEAESLNQIEKVETLREEYDNILDHLSQSLGLAGKSRKVGSTIEKARSAVTWRIRNSIKKIEPLNSELATHLSKSIKTGTYCSYKPEVKINWSF